MSTDPEPLSITLLYYLLFTNLLHTYSSGSREICTPIQIQSHKGMLKCFELELAVFVLIQYSLLFRSHKKSTTGCSTCKARKVKVCIVCVLAQCVSDGVQCDEKRPVCGRCSIHFANITSCDYTIAPSKRSIKKRFTSVAEETQPKKKVVIGVSQETPNLNGAGKLTLHSNRKPDLTNVGACRCPCHLPGIQSHISLLLTDL